MMKTRYEKLIKCGAMVMIAGTVNAAQQLIKSGTWNFENYHGRMTVVEQPLENGSSEVKVIGATNKCDTAFLMTSRRQQLPADTIELVVELEVSGKRFFKNRTANKWQNAVLWYGADGKELPETPLSHILMLDDAEYHTMRDWCKVPEGAKSFEVKFGFDHPNLLSKDYVIYRNVSIDLIPAGSSREAEFTALWKGGEWARPILYPSVMPKVSRITLRDDGMTLVDGEPFFPIGAYGVCKREFNGNDFDRAFAGLKEAGFNFAQTYGDAYEPGFFEAARKYGFKLWVESKTPSEKLLDIGRYEPSVLAWYLGDDTSGWLTPQQLKDRNAMVKAVDPNRITCQAESPHTWEIFDDYCRYVPYTDVFMPEIYWVRGDKGDVTDTNCVAVVIRDMKRIADDARIFDPEHPHGFWPILQYFQGWKIWRHFPSREQLWATSWASIVHGANGIVWYTYGGRPEQDNYGMTSTPERWQLMSELATTIKSYIPVLLERTPKAQPKVEILEGPKLDPLGLSPSVTCLLKRHAGKDYLFGVNACTEPVKVRITLPNGKVRVETFKSFGVLLP